MAEGKRIFRIEGKDYPDPDPSKTPDEVRQAWVEFFPELSNSEIKETKKGANTIYEFKRRVGTKG